jgi:hypothetical protein
MRRSRRLVLRVVAGLAAMAIGLTVVMAATRPKIKVLTPPSKLCVGNVISVGAKAKGSAKAKVKVTVVRPDGSVGLKTKKKVGKKMKAWSVPVQQPGIYVTTYKSKPKKWTFSTEVSACGTGGGSGGGGGGTPGTVDINDDDAGASMFSMSNLAPGDVRTSCLTASYAGSLPATVRLYGTTTGTGLAPHLDLTVTRGTGGAFGSCAGFTPDPVNHVGAGPGVIYDGTLDGWPDTYATGLVDPSAVPEQWTAGESHTYRFEVVLPPDMADSAQALTTGQTFVWEARD